MRAHQAGQFLHAFVADPVFVQGAVCGERGVISSVEGSASDLSRYVPPGKARLWGFDEEEREVLRRGWLVAALFGAEVVEVAVLAKPAKRAIVGGVALPGGRSDHESPSPGAAGARSDGGGPKMSYPPDVRLRPGLLSRTRSIRGTERRRIALARRRGSVWQRPRR